MQPFTWPSSWNSSAMDSDLLPTCCICFILWATASTKLPSMPLGTSLMALGMMLPGMISGYVQEWLGYQHFFVYVMFCTLPGMFIIPFLKIDPGFGKKKREEKGEK